MTIRLPMLRAALQASPPAPIAAAAVAFAWFALAGPAHARLDPAMQRLYAGVYSNACTDRRALTLKFYDDVMTVERAGRSVTANRVRTSKTHAKAGSAPDFKAVVAGDVSGGDGLVFALHHNADGLFAVIEGGARSLAALGPGVQGQRLRHCDPNRNALPGATQANAPQGPPDLLRDARFRAAYRQALGPMAGEPWLARMDGPAPALRQVALGGVDYTLAAVCKPHDCADHNMIVLWAPGSGSLIGLVQQRGRKTLLGEPPATLARRIDGLWAREFRASAAPLAPRARP